MTSSSMKTIWLCVREREREIKREREIDREKEKAEVEGERKARREEIKEIRKQGERER